MRFAIKSASKSTAESANWWQNLLNAWGSIAKPNPELPLSVSSTDNKLFFPTFGSWGARLFWLGMVVFFSLYEIAITMRFVQDWQFISRHLLELALTNGLIVLLIVGHLHVMSDSLLNKTKHQAGWYAIATVLVAVPLAHVVAAVINWGVLGVSWSWSRLLLSTLVDLLIVMMIALLMLYYFMHQYEKIRVYQQKFQQRLLEQNEQLKARITPHFFFNMLNTMQYLTETDPQAAQDLIRSVSSLYRVSFDEVHEVALIDEIELCQHYLKIEQCRFGDKLTVNWDLPDDDILYDMVIPSLSLQMLIEKLIGFVVEMVTEVITIWIGVTWQNNWVSIELRCGIPASSYDTLEPYIKRYLNFNEQILILQRYFGKQATVGYRLDNSTLHMQMRYPLADVAVTMI